MAVPITAFLRDKTFEPEHIEVMSAAFLDACATLGLADSADMAAELIATRIIELADRGVRNRTELYRAAVDGFIPYTAE